MHTYFFNIDKVYRKFRLKATEKYIKLTKRCAKL